MEILVSLSNVKVQDTSAKVTVEAGKATKTKPAMAKIIVSTAAKKNAAVITFKPTAEATIEKPKYEARLNRMGKGFRMKNAADCIQALKVFGFDPKDAAPIREFYSGKITAAQFKKAMGTKSYQHKADAKAADVVKLINATKLPTSGKGKVTRKMVDGIFADYQTFPIIREADVKKLLKAISDFNDGKLKPTALKSIRGLFARSKTNARNPKVTAMGKKFNAVIDLMESTGASSGQGEGELSAKVVRNADDGKQQTVFGIYNGRILSRGIEVSTSALKPVYYKVANGEVAKQIRGKKQLDAEFKSLGINNERIYIITLYATQQITPQEAARAFKSGKVDSIKKTNAAPASTKVTQPKAVALKGANSGYVAIEGLDKMAYAFKSGEKKSGIRTSFGEFYPDRKTLAATFKAMSKFPQFTTAHEKAIRAFVNGDYSVRAFTSAFNGISNGKSPSKAPMKKPPVKKATKAESAPASKVSGNVVTDGNLSVELPTDSRLTAAEANKIIGYFSQLLENKEVAKAQANRALKDLASGEMTPHMKKRWLARVGASEVRPVPRKLVTLLREEPASKPVTRLKARGQQAPAKKRKDSVRPMANSTPHAIAKAITKAGYKGTLAARQRGDLVEIYNVSDNSVVWSWNRKTFKAIDFTQERTNKMYSTLNLDGMKQTEKVDAVASILSDM